MRSSMLRSVVSLLDQSTSNVFIISDGCNLVGFSGAVKAYFQVSGFSRMQSRTPKVLSPSHNLVMNRKIRLLSYLILNIIENDI